MSKKDLEQFLICRREIFDLVEKGDRSPRLSKELNRQRTILEGTDHLAYDAFTYVETLLRNRIYELGISCTTGVHEALVKEHLAKMTLAIYDTFCEVVVTPTDVAKAEAEILEREAEEERLKAQRRTRRANAGPILQMPVKVLDAADNWAQKDE